MLEKIDTQQGSVDFFYIFSCNPKSAPMLRIYCVELTVVISIGINLAQITLAHPVRWFFTGPRRKGVIDMKPFNYLLGLFFMVFAHSAGAIPLTASDDSGYRGDAVASILTEPNPDNLNSLWLDILFDENALTFNNILSTTLDIFTVDTTDAATGKVVAAFSAPATINIGSTELLQALFTIRGDALYGDTLVEFQCHDEGQGCFDYFFEPVSARITVLQSTQIPLPATIWLLGLGFSALAGMRLRR